MLTHLPFLFDLQASVIILFNNEMLSALLRTVWSVIRMTPERYLHEVILVDDASNITGERERERVSDSDRVELFGLRLQAGICSANCNFELCDVDSLFFAAGLP